MDTTELKEMLEKSGVDYSSWGKTSTSKPISSLLKEIEDGESILEEIAGGIVRYVSIVYVYVVYSYQVLKEDRSEWKDGRPPRRRGMSCSVAEKMVSGESAGTAAARGIEEELGITIDESRLKPVAETESKEDSSSYPGLITASKKYVFLLELQNAEYKAEGYVEDASDKVTYFIWVDLPQELQPAFS
ncbi:MAG TPA: NUDIX domain-containing protein [Patescibacteria group bacterium]